MTDSVKVTKRKLTDYRPDDKNANRGSQRGKQMIATSFKENGAGRSVLADKDGMFIAGNQSVEGAAAAGIEDVLEIETDGSVLVVVRRKDLDLDSDNEEVRTRARRLAIADNRTNEISLEWNPDVLLEDVDLLKTMFRDDEIDALIAAGEVEKEVNGAVAGDGPEGGRIVVDKKKQVKPVLYVDQIATFEQAIRATGINNRGEALIAVCKFYLDSHQEGAADVR